MTPLTSARLAPETVQTVDAYASRVLACPPELARRGGVHLLATRQRGLAAWHGYALPVIGLAFAPGAVIACRPDLVERLRNEMGSDISLPSLDLSALRRLLRAIRRTLPNAYTLAGDFRVADASTFVPSRSQHRAERIAPDDPVAAHLRSRLDGAVFGVIAPHGKLVAWAALKLKSDRVWEVAVATEPDYRGRGYARDVVSAATAYTLDQQRTPIYIYDLDNTTSGFVARSVGYQLYAETVLAEY